MIDNEFSGYSDFNIVGAPSEEFLEEVTDKTSIKKSAVFFALLTEGLPGDPDFGVGLSGLYGELNVDRLAGRLERRAELVETYVPDIEFRQANVERIPSQRFIGADLIYADTDVRENILIPLGF